MIYEDEYRVKTLDILKQEARSIPLRGFIASKRDGELMRAMKKEGWVTMRTMNGIRCVAITQEGRRVLKTFQRIYR